MAPINGKPFLEILLESLLISRFSRAIIAVGYKSNHIKNYFGNSFNGMELAYSTEKRPLGTGGAAKLAVKKARADSVFVLNGDTYAEFDPKLVVNGALGNEKPTLVIKKINQGARFGNVEIDGSTVTGFNEKKNTRNGFINTGVYFFPTGLLGEFCSKNISSLENDYLHPLAAERKLSAHITDGYFIDIGVEEDYLRAQRELGLALQKRYA